MGPVQPKALLNAALARPRIGRAAGSGRRIGANAGLSRSPKVSPLMPDAVQPLAAGRYPDIAAELENERQKTVPFAADSVGQS